MVFHDGTAFDAEAMVFSLRRFLDIGTLSYAVGGRIAEIEAASPHELKLHLSRPSTSLKGLLTGQSHPGFTEGLQAGIRSAFSMTASWAPAPTGWNDFERTNSGWSPLRTTGARHRRTTGWT